MPLFVPSAAAPPSFTGIASPSADVPATASSTGASGSFFHPVPNHAVYEFGDVQGRVVVASDQVRLPNPDTFVAWDLLHLVPRVNDGLNQEIRRLNVQGRVEGSRNRHTLARNRSRRRVAANSMHSSSDDPGMPPC